ncbi:MAG: hypothetical protein LBP59_14675 [Planctomycetaceae bacterium]|nr:hypothetical protein [Planctomycetaceae bacterium]
MRLYSTANERCFDLKRLFVCLSAKCRRDARDPLVSPAFQDRGRNYISSAFLFAFRQIAGGTPAIRWSHQLFRIAGEIISQTPFCLHFGKMQARRPRSVGLRFDLKMIHRLHRLERFFLGTRRTIFLIQKN